jgi:hypothetical protein
MLPRGITRGLELAQQSRVRNQGEQWIALLGIGARLRSKRLNRAKPSASRGTVA